MSRQNKSLPPTKPTVPEILQVPLSLKNRLLLEIVEKQSGRDAAEILVTLAQHSLSLAAQAMGPLPAEVETASTKIPALPIVREDAVEQLTSALADLTTHLFQACLDPLLAQRAHKWDGPKRLRMAGMLEGWAHQLRSSVKRRSKSLTEVAFN